MQGEPGETDGDPATSLADILERVLDKGIVKPGDIRVNLLEIELLTIKIRLLFASVDKAREIGIDWWERDPTLSCGQHDLAEENRGLVERVGALESRSAGRTHRRVAGLGGGPGANSLLAIRAILTVSARPIGCAACVDRCGRGYTIPVDSRDDAPEDGATITRDEAQAWFTRFLLHRVRRDEYPSTTQLDLIVKSIPREMLDEYLCVLVDKVARDIFPSVPLLSRIQHVIERLPHSGYGHRARRAEDNDIEQDVTTGTASDEKTHAVASARTDDEISR